MYERCGSIYVWSGVRSVLVAMRTSHNNARGQCRDSIGVNITNIKLSIDFSLTKPLKSLTYKRYRVSIFNYNSVKSSIVNVKLNTSF